MATRPNYQRGYHTGDTHGRGYGSRQSSGTGRRGTGYVYGNLAHQLEEVPERRQRPERRRRHKVYPQQKPAAMPSIGFSSFVFLTMAVILVLGAGFAYLHVQSGITKMKDQVVNLQAEITETKQKNDEDYQKVMDSVDLSEVYSVATKEFGMIQAVDNKVYKYDNKKSDMVKQYGDIPEDKK